MVMIDLGDEKKSLGVISVTCVTKQSLTGQAGRSVSGASSQVRRLLKFADCDVLAGRIRKEKVTTGPAAGMGQRRRDGDQRARGHAPGLRLAGGVHTARLHPVVPGLGGYVRRPQLAAGVACPGMTAGGIRRGETVPRTPCSVQYRRERFGLESMKTRGQAAIAQMPRRLTP
jgi:hypothetical protein